MTKLVTVRITVAADDDAPYGDIQARLRAIVEEHGIERLPVGAEAPDAASPRVHWATAEVVREAVRTAASQAARKPRTPRLEAV